MSSIRRFTCWVLAVAAVVAGMLLAAGSTKARAGPDHAALPQSGSSANFPGPSRTAINAAVAHPCSADDSNCSDPPLTRQPWRHRRHDHFRIPPIYPVPVPPVCQATVPNLVNLPEDRARRAVAAVGLVLMSNHPGNNRIVSQVPVAGTRVLCGWAVAVTVEQPPPPPPPPAPSPVEIASPDPPPAVVVPPPPIVVPPAVAVPRIDPMPWFWPLIIALLALCAALLLGLLLWLAARARKGPKWVRAHVHAVASAAAGPSVDVMEPRTDHSAPPCVVRLEPHADSGQQVLEEVGR